MRAAGDCLTGEAEISTLQGVWVLCDGCEVSSKVSVTPSVWP